MAINIVGKIDDLVHISRVLISVSDKSGLDTFIPGLLEANPDIQFFSTGGTYQTLKGLIGPCPGRLTQVADYTGQPETQGGLVKTLDFKIYLGLLTETYNEAHREDLRRTSAVPIDMVVVNLYPFRETVAATDVTAERARGNIDIGGPCMIRAAAKNFIRVASVVSPGDYDALVEQMKASGGALSLAQRFALARKAFDHTAAYDRAIADYLGRTAFEKVAGCYGL
jgi:phosphoribosylaminoimidazolecarboxamide formyltransferase / IMP cyclohydrolase